MTSRIEASIQRALVDWLIKKYPQLVTQATLNEIHSTQKMHSKKRWIYDLHKQIL